MTTFLALLRRDLVVAGRNAGPLLLATLTQPILVVLVFGNIMPRMNLVADSFRTVMLPGLMAITMMMAGVQGVLMPLTQDLSGTREVDERILAPIGVLGVALEKVVAGAIHAALAGLTALPAMMLLMHETAGMSVHPRWLSLLPLVALLRPALRVVRAHPRHQRPAPLRGPPLRGRARSHDAVRLRLLPLGGAHGPRAHPVRLLVEPARVHERGHALRRHPGHAPHALRSRSSAGLAFYFALLVYAGRPLVRAEDDPLARAPARPRPAERIREGGERGKARAVVAGVEARDVQERRLQAGGAGADHVDLVEVAHVEGALASGPNAIEGDLEEARVGLLHPLFERVDDQERYTKRSRRRSSSRSLPFEFETTTTRRPAA